MSQYLLAIESSCDETAAAVITRDLQVLSNVVASQAELHERFGGVVPEIASRAHVERILPVIDEALQTAEVEASDLTAIAVVTEPGLVGSLLVGLTAAKTLAMVLDIPLVAINHVEAHLYACRLGAGRDIFPTVGLVVSGGHTNLYDCRSAVDYRMIGATIDDAAGEAFDKAAAILGLPYPGGPNVERTARSGNEKAYRFPRTFLKEDRLEFSFSGLKTALLYEVHGQPGALRVPPPMTPERLADLCASFQVAVVDVLIAKLELALRQTRHRSVCLGGGVAANGYFRERAAEMARSRGVELFVSPREYCTDNAGMGAVGWELLDRGRVADLEADVSPGLIR